MSSEERLRALGRSGLESRRLRGDLTALCSLLRRGRGEGGAELCSPVPSARVCGFLERWLMPHARQCL